jgi:DegV family protein with EDD domain
MSPGIYYPIYKESIEKGLKILSIHMGENLSATEQQARMATRELNGKKRCIFNTGTVSMAEGYMAIKAEELAAAGKDLDEIFQTLKGIKTRTSLRAITPNIPFIEKSGRVPKFETKLAKLFNIVPILQIDNGISEKVAKAISMERALSWTTRFVVKKSVERVTILDFEANENANRLYEKLIKNNIPEEIIYREALGPVTGSHGGQEP